MPSAISNVGRVLSAANLQTKDLVWLLVVELGGKAYRFSSETVQITDGDGVIHPYRGSLDGLDYSTDFELFNLGADVPSIQISVVFPDSIASLARNGIHLTSGTGELSLWVRGSNLEERVIMVRGRLADASYGDDSEPVSFLIEGDAFVDNAIFPDPSATITTKTWPDAIEASLGTTYPFVWGTPGEMVGADGAAVQVNGSPAIKVDATKLLIAGHRVTATSVVIRDETDGDEAVFAVTHEPDGLGRICATVTLTGADPPEATVGHDFRVKWGDGPSWTGGWTWSFSDIPARDFGSWPSSDEGRIARVGSGTTWAYYILIDGPAEVWTEVYGSGGGGITSARDGRIGSPMNDAGELFQFMLRQSTIKHDAGRLATVSAQLESVRVDGYIGEQVSPWEWLTDNLLSILPISVGVSGSEGIFPLLWPMDATSSDVVYALVEASAGEGNCERQSSVTYEDIDIANEIRLDFAWGDHKDKPSTFTTVTGAPEDVNANELNAGVILTTLAVDGSPAGYVNAAITGWPNAYARFSHARHGRHAVKLESRIVYDRPTAEAIVAWMARAKATPPRLIQYDVDTKLAWLQPGDVVTITDGTVRFDSQIAIIQAAAFSELAVRLTLIIIEDPLRDSNDK